MEKKMKKYRIVKFNETSNGKDGKANLDHCKDGDSRVQVSKGAARAKKNRHQIKV
jgi:hypothetical protein